MSEQRKGRTDTELAKAGLKECSICLSCWALGGFTRHFNSCKTKDARRQHALASLQETQARKIQQPEARFHQDHTENVYLGTPAPLLPAGDRLGVESNDRSADSNSLNEDRSGLETREGSVETRLPSPDGGLLSGGGTHNECLEDGSIRVVYHPRANRCHQTTGLLRPRPKPASAFYQGRVAPWAPFRTHGDFRFARSVANSDMDEDQINEQLSLHHEATNSPVTLRNCQEMRSVEKRLANLLTPFKRVPFSASYRTGRNTSAELDLDVWIKPLNEWLLELVQHPELQPHLHFDSMQKFRWSDGRWVRFVDEPWSADDWAKAQSSLPEDGLPLNIHLYIDKTIASSSGTKKLYPVVARLANLPRDIRNGTGVGGGQVVGLIPVVEDRPKGLPESAFADFKCAVWHQAIGKLLETIQSEARMGHAIKFDQCASLGLEAKTWRLFPSVSIISADYEEQITIACNKGVSCLWPCVRCLTPDDKLHDLSFEAKLREPESLLRLLKQVESLGVTESKSVLKEQGFRPVQNAFFSLGPRTNVFRALSYDTLHTDDLGRWGKHLWPLLKETLKAEPADVQDMPNKRVDSVPPWPDLNHFSDALSMEFSDGTKYEDLLRVILHGAFGLSKQHAQLVRLIRLQAEIRLIASLQVQTEDTIALGRERITQFNDISQACTAQYKKHFNFPKMHQLVHLFDDIQNKGVTANYSTKPGENMHAVLHYAYDRSSKKRGTVDAEVLHKSHVLAAYDLVAAEIKTMEALSTTQEEPEDGPEDVYHVKLASRKRLLTLALLEEQNRGDKAFVQLGTRVRACIARLDPSFKFSVDSPVKVCAFPSFHTEGLKCF
ncbi:hypothetical protein FRC08_010999 [Ceratobasidium sp. 394]|nr:hypothetical protein FRC08_010999 [Ceratobasidium sp. 394]